MNKKNKNKKKMLIKRYSQVNYKNNKILNNIKRYCVGKSRLNKIDEKKFLSNKNLKELTNVNLSKNSGKISEWYVSHILEEKEIEFISQPIIKYGKNKKRYIQPDFYVPSKNLFIEVKSRTYNCGGTASEKMDHIARKYSTKLELTEDYKDAKVLVVFCAGELFEESTLQLINYKLSKFKYIREFIEFSKRHSVLDWISINDINKYV